MHFFFFFLEEAIGIPDSEPFIFSRVCGGQDGLPLGLSPLVTWTGCIKFVHEGASVRFCFQG